MRTEMYDFTDTPSDLDLQTAVTKARYQRIAHIYDFMEDVTEKRYIPWRKKLWSLVIGPKVLEVGVGTGKNFLYYPSDMDITAIDLTPEMLKRAKNRMERLGITVKIQIGDVQRLEFPDNFFDTVLATLVFCSVPNPVQGLKEILRVLKPDGRLLLLEHTRADNEVLGNLMDWFNPLAIRVTGANINRNTVENVFKAGFKIESIENLSRGNIFKFIMAQPAT